MPGCEERKCLRTKPELEGGRIKLGEVSFRSSGNANFGKIIHFYLLRIENKHENLKIASALFTIKF